MSSIRNNSSDKKLIAALVTIVALLIVACCTLVWHLTGAVSAIAAILVVASAMGIYMRWEDRKVNPRSVKKTGSRRSPQGGTSASRSKAVIASGLAFGALAFLIIGAVVGTKVIAPTSQNIAANTQIDNLQTQINDLTVKLEEAKAANGTAQQVKPVEHSKRTLTENQSLVLGTYPAQNIDPNTVRVGSEIDIEWAKKVSAGGTTFGDAIYTEADATTFLKSGTPEAKAALASLRDNTKATDAELQDTANWTAVQYTTPIQWNGNTFYVDGRAVDGGSKVDPAGSVGIYYTGQSIKLLSSDGKLAPENLYGFRGACANPQLAPVTPVKPSVTYSQGGSAGGNAGGETHVRVINCFTNPEMPGCQPPVINCFTNPELPGCQPPPVNCETHPEMPECNPNPPVNCETHPEMPECNPNPPVVKCPDPNVICGTPDSGGEQQPVQDNDPELVKPTPGYNPGDAEEIIGSQPHCGNGVPCGLDPTENGTVVDGSENGGGAPGGGVDFIPTPGGNGGGQDNPDYTAPPSTNPDLGTADPDDSSTGGETVTPGGSDPFEGIELPNADTSQAPAADSASTYAPEAAAPAAVEESSYVAPAPVQDTTSYSDSVTQDNSTSYSVSVDSSQTSSASGASSDTSVGDQNTNNTTSTNNSKTVADAAPSLLTGVS